MCTEEKCTTNGGWSAWGEFTACSVTCVPRGGGGGGGGGTKSRFRRCDSPPPSDGGLFCVGRAIDIQGSRSISILHLTSYLMSLGKVVCYRVLDLRPSARVHATLPNPI